MRWPVIRISKGTYDYLLCSRAHNKGACRRLAVPYQAAEDAMLDGIDALVDGAPRGQATEGIEAEMEAHSANLLHLEYEILELMDLVLAERSPAARQRLRTAEAEAKRERAALRDLRERRERLGRPFVQKRLEDLRKALKADPFDRTEANKALRAAIERLGLDPEQGKIWIQWRDTAHATDYITVPSKHWQPFGNPPAP
jgi:hypothetical protein